MVNILKSFKSSLTCVAWCSNKNNNCFTVCSLFSRNSHKIRQKLKSHIFKCTSRTVPKFQYIFIAVNINSRRNLRRGKLLSSISAAYAIIKFFFAEICQKLLKNGFSSVNIAHSRHWRNFVNIKIRKFNRNKKSAFFTYTLSNSLSSRYPDWIISCRCIKHNIVSFHLII